MNILVTGANGQLGSEINELAKNFRGFNFIFTDSDILDITSKEKLYDYFNSLKLDYCINCAAYTAVDKSEDNLELANVINNEAVKNLVEVCKIHDTTLIHISTDFIFDGKSNMAYTESDLPNPVNVYGRTKLEGEKWIQSNMSDYFIIRTSWLYSSFGHNFVKTMLRLGNEKKMITVVDDQIGTPTFAGDLALMILKIIKGKSTAFGMYHYSNEGIASWYDFAYEIFKLSNINMPVKPISTKKFPLPAKRPVFTVLNKNKIKTTFDIEIPHWSYSLEKCLQIINKI